MRLLFDNGITDPADLPSLAIEVLSATGVSPDLRLRMLGDVLTATGTE
jgi:hypothetical protein